MRDVRQSRRKFQQLRNNLLDTDQYRCISELTIFWKFIHDDPFIEPVVSELVDPDFHMDQWIEDHQGQRSGINFPPDEKERASLCYAILRPDNYASGDDLWRLAFSLGMNHSKISDSVQEFFSQVLNPLYQYVDHILIERESMVTPSDVMLEILDSTETPLLNRFDATTKALKTAYRDLYAASGAVVFQNVGNSCRNALISFANDIYSGDMCPDGESAPKGDDATRKIQFALRASVSKRNRLTDAIELQVRAAWDMAAALVHEKNATDSDAKSCVMMTYLGIWSVANKLPRPAVAD